VSPSRVAINYRQSLKCKCQQFELTRSPEFFYIRKVEILTAVLPKIPVNNHRHFEDLVASVFCVEDSETVALEELGTINF
jgi:hypothetical protein